jgi:carbon-monoxide dehydrogenase medium subunit
MKPPPFRYERASSVDEALDLLARGGGDAKVLAGGQSLVALLNLRLSRPAVLVDIGSLDELRYVEQVNGHLEIGALTTQASVEANDEIRDACPLLGEAIEHVAHPPVRNRGTVGGSIAHADPAAELPLVLCALEGSVRLRSPGGERQVQAAEFFRGFLMTALEDDELLTAVALPVAQDGEGFAFEEFARRPGDFALVAVACRLRRDEAGVAVRLAVGGVASVPVIVERVVPQVDSAGIEAVTDAVDEAIDPAADIHGTPAYRRALARELTTRAITRALDASGGA